MSGRFDQVPLINKNEEKDFFPRNSLHDPGEDVHDVFIREHLWRQNRCCRVLGLGAAIVLVLFAAGSIAYYFLVLQGTNTHSEGTVGLDQQSPTAGTAKEEIIVEVTNNFSYDTEKLGIQGTESDMQDVIATGKDDSAFLDSVEDTDENYFEDLYEETSEELIEVKDLDTEGIYDDNDGTTEQVDVELSEKYSETVAVDWFGADNEEFNEAGESDESSEILTGELEVDDDRSYYKEDGSETEDSNNNASLNELDEKQDSEAKETIQSEEGNAWSPVSVESKDESTNNEANYRTESREYKDTFKLEDVDISLDSITTWEDDVSEDEPKDDTDDEDDLGEKSLWSQVFGDDYDEFNRDIDTDDYAVQGSFRYNSFSDTEEKEDLSA